MSGVLDILNSPWAITTPMHQQIVRIYLAHANSGNADFAAIKAQCGDMHNERRPYQIINRTAVIHAVGIMAKRMNLLMSISGGVSTEIVRSEFAAALADPEVDRIIFDIDSPGGNVAGCELLANTIFEARGQKPIIAVANETMASGAYWFGSSADQVFLTSQTSQIGSIGVRMELVEFSAKNEREGVRAVDIYAGKYKASGSENRPLSEEDVEYFQGLVDKNYTTLVEAVARNRGIPINTVLSEMADGRVFIGSDGISRGYADGIATLEQLINAANVPEISTGEQMDAPDEEEEPMTGKPAASGTQPAPTALKTEDITASWLQANAPNVLTEVLAAERKRIRDIEAINTVQGHEALVQQCKLDGTSAEQTALLILQAEGKLNRATMESIIAEAPKPAPAAIIPDGAEAQANKSKTPEEEWESNPKLRAEFGQLEDYKAFLKASSEGRTQLFQTAGRG